MGEWREVTPAELMAAFGITPDDVDAAAREHLTDDEYRLIWGKEKAAK